MDAVLKERPIIFSGDMVRAILEGRKTQTRRVVKGYRIERPTPPKDAFFFDWYRIPSNKWCGTHTISGQGVATTLCPYGVPGDLLWVKESLRGDGEPGGRRVGIVRYAADGWMVIDEGSDVIWEWKRPTLAARFCPRWASRITLKLTDVRVERVQDISEDDAKAEGVESFIYDGAGVWRDYELGQDTWQTTARGSFVGLWDSLNAKRGYSWESNPWVWALTFVKV
jgi:hypothetical protein